MSALGPTVGGKREKGRVFCRVRALASVAPSVRRRRCKHWANDDRRTAGIEYTHIQLDPHMLSLVSLEYWRAGTGEGKRNSTDATNRSPLRQRSRLEKTRRPTARDGDKRNLLLFAPCSMNSVGCYMLRSSSYQHPNHHPDPRSRHASHRSQLLAVHQESICACDRRVTLPQAERRP